MPYKKQPEGDRMNPKEYAIYDRTFMIFGSMMNSMQGNLQPEERIGPEGKDLNARYWKQVGDEVWEWCESKVRKLVEDAYEKTASDSNNGDESPL